MWSNLSFPVIKVTHAQATCTFLNYKFVSGFLCLRKSGESERLEISSYSPSFMDFGPWIVRSGPALNDSMDLAIMPGLLCQSFRSSFFSASAMAYSWVDFRGLFRFSFCAFGCCSVWAGIGWKGSSRCGKSELNATLPTQSCLFQGLLPGTAPYPSLASSSFRWIHSSFPQNFAAERLPCFFSLLLIWVWREMLPSSATAAN